MPLFDLFHDDVVLQVGSPRFWVVLLDRIYLEQALSLDESIVCILLLGLRLFARLLFLISAPAEDGLIVNVALVLPRHCTDDSHFVLPIPVHDRARRRSRFRAEGGLGPLQDIVYSLLLIVLQLRSHEIGEGQALGAASSFGHVDCYIKELRVKVIGFELDQLLYTDLVRRPALLLLETLE